MLLCLAKAFALQPPRHKYLYLHLLHFSLFSKKSLAFLLAISYKRRGVTISHSRKANCYDNACCENFFGHLKSEKLELFDIPETNEELIRMVEEYIHFFNYEKPQRKLKGMTPMEYRESYLNS